MTLVIPTTRIVPAGNVLTVLGELDLENCIFSTCVESSFYDGKLQGANRFRTAGYLLCLVP